MPIVELPLKESLISQTRKCRQCFASKPLQCFLNKSKTNFCVICDRCRSSQRRRYHLNRFKKLKKAEQMARSQEGSSTSNFSPVTTTSPVEDGSQTTYASYTNTPLDSTPHEGVVPCSKWICIKPFMEFSGMKNDICTAQLIYHPIMCCNFASPQCGNDIPKEEEDKPVTKD